MDVFSPFEASDPAARLQAAVRQVMRIDDVSLGGRGGPLVRFRGQLLIDSQEAYDRLEPVFAREDATLLFRRAGAEHVVLAVPGRIRPPRSNPWVNVGLFALTLFSVALAGALYGYEGPPPADMAGLIRLMLGRLPEGLPFALSLLAILGTHEFGHYLAARAHRTAVSLPYFLPFPGSLFGTMGAFIRLKQPPRNRRALLDIGLAGPLAGLVVALPLLLWGLSLSPVGTLPATPAEAAGQGIEGNSLLYLAAKWLVTGRLLPEPVSYGGIAPALYWMRYVFLGAPVPYGGLDVLLHPIAWAGWAGLLVTGLNLIPAGQLDGGHVLYVLMGGRAQRVLPLIVLGLAALGFVWSGWWLWAGLVFLLGRVHAQPLDDITPLDPRRRALARFGLLVFVLVFTPVPLQLMAPAF